MDDGLITGWRKAQASKANGNCVELAPLDDGAAVRDSKDPEGPMLKFDAEAWAWFKMGFTAGDFDDLYQCHRILRDGQYQGRPLS